MAELPEYVLNQDTDEIKPITGEIPTVSFEKPEDKESEITENVKKESITHHGSSEINQIPKAGTKYPRSGEIDLMKYADENFSQVPNGSARMIANELDVKGLLIISGISRK